MYKLENYFYTDKSKFGYKMLQKMGWSEGKGLGVSEDGALEHIKVKMKCDTSGNITLISEDGALEQKLINAYPIFICTEPGVCSTY